MKIVINADPLFMERDVEDGEILDKAYENDAIIISNDDDDDADNDDDDDDDDVSDSSAAVSNSWN